MHAATLGNIGPGPQGNVRHRIWKIRPLKKYSCLGGRKYLWQISLGPRAMSVVGFGKFAHLKNILPSIGPDAPKARLPVLYNLLFSLHSLCPLWFLGLTRSSLHSLDPRYRDYVVIYSRRNMMLQTENIFCYIQEIFHPILKQRDMYRVINVLKVWEWESPLIKSK